jgi:glycosyltransferase involved in cell wall biosynthesis
MSRARCLVLPRPDSQQARAGFPTKLGEYLALGRPVVVTKVGEIPRFLEDGRTAYLVETGHVENFANKLREVFADRERAEKIGLAGKEVAKSCFDWRNHEGTFCEWMRLFV